MNPCQPEAPQQLAATTCITTTLIPTEATNRRNHRGRRQGSGRSTQLRSITLQLTLTIPAPPPVPPSPPAPPSPAAASLLQPSPMQAAAAAAAGDQDGSSSSFQPHFLSAGTPIEGIPEWMSRSKTPSAAVATSSGSVTMATSTPGFGFTPMEGVPERAMTGRRHRQPSLQPMAGPTPSAARRLAAVTPMEGVPERGMPYMPTSSRLARLARLPIWHPDMGAAEAAADEALDAAAPGWEEQVAEEEQLIHRASDDVLRSESASPEPEDDGAADAGPQPPAADDRASIPWAGKP